MYIVGAVWTLSSVMWLRAENIPMTILWIVVGVLQLISATVTRKTEKLEEEQSEEKQDDDKNSN
jgi:uncharacterized membrane protein